MEYVVGAVSALILKVSEVAYSSERLTEKLSGDNKQFIYTWTTDIPTN